VTTVEGAFSIWHWLLVLVIVLLIFGPRKLPDVGRGLGEAIRGFKEALQGSDAGSVQSGTEQKDKQNTPHEKDEPKT
jgi:sec-independent protein translocase protein TatA